MSSQASPAPDAPAPAAPPVIDYPILFVPEAAAAAVKAASRNRTVRIVSLLISVGILVALYVFFLDALGGISWPFVVLAVALPLAYLIAAIFREVSVRREASRVLDGLALGVERTGLLVVDRWVAWDDISSLEARPGRLGRGPRLVVASPAGQIAELPLNYLSVLPAGVDNAIAALTAGRVRVDFARLGA